MTANRSPTMDDKQRKALEDSERRASAQQPGSFDDEAIDSKIVEVGGDLTGQPISGIDPKTPEPPRR